MLVPEEWPVPAPDPGEILVKVAAAGVGRPVLPENFPTGRIISESVLNL